MTMEPLTPGCETVLRLLWKRGGPQRRLCDLAEIRGAHIRRAVELGLVETREVRARRRARLTATGVYYARLLAALPPSVKSLRITPPPPSQGDIEHWIARAHAAE